ncbi:hypothetical protein Rhopal_005480-T1 [Rhodotorula paludigena]|uniref:Uncharacterized protein n=1 Tax=Rhodotorula paludigena TaxID=86838 RepID=A0AAV5GIH4_9BASI|nr:hypothetical protein Rhopal_005480-T1 [Rhodotorula paludigena]
MSNAHRWQRPKPIPVGATTSLSLEQQQILAAVPRWKKAWVRPSNLRPGQNPNYKICKWVIDTDMAKSEGTEEEMQAALQEVTAGNVPLPESASAAAAATADSTAPTSLFPSAVGTPAEGTPAPPAAAAPPAAVPAAALAASGNPIAQVQHADPAKPPQGTAPDGTEPSVAEAVKPLEDVPMEGVIGTGGEVKQEHRSLVGEDQAQTGR